MQAQVSVVIPVLNDGDKLMQLLQCLCGYPVEVIVVDGGSTDDTVARLASMEIKLIKQNANRGLQLSTGCSCATGTMIWMLHADTGLNPTAIARLQALANVGDDCWGHFDVQIRGQGEEQPLWSWCVASSMNLRSRITGIATGDQGIFVTKKLLEKIGGMPEQRLMEDVELSTRLRALMPPINLDELLTTSARRWEQHGVLKTIAQMWWLRLQYWFGTSADALAKQYYGR